LVEQRAEVLELRVLGELIGEPLLGAARPIGLAGLLLRPSTSPPDVLADGFDERLGCQRPAFVVVRLDGWSTGIEVSERYATVYCLMMSMPASLGPPANGGIHRVRVTVTEYHDRRRGRLLTDEGADDRRICLANAELGRHLDT
jgi:hypothetical protein